MAVSIIQTMDMDLVREIVVSPDIWECIADDVEKETYYPAYGNNDAWLLVKDGDEIIGIIYLHVDTSCSIGFHPYLYKNKRRLGRDMIKSFYTWYLENALVDFIKINTVIPECFKSAINFAKRVGFSHEGISRASFKKDNKIYDRHFFGITKKEIEALTWAE
jgi:RimJ/RimL family protein N-acetyltransferase